MTSVNILQDSGTTTGRKYNIVKVIAYGQQEGNYSCITCGHAELKMETNVFSASYFTMKCRNAVHCLEFKHTTTSSLRKILVSSKGTV